MYLRRVTDLINELTDDPRFVVTDFTVNSGYNDNYFEFLEKHRGFRFCDAVAAYYRELGELRISWTFSPEHFEALGVSSKHVNHYDVYGEIRIGDINSFTKQGQYGLHWQNELNYSNLSQAEQTTHDHFCPFDAADAERRHCFGPLVEDGQVTSQMLLCEQESGFSALAIDFTTYVDTMLRYRGFRDWQDSMLMGRADKTFREISEGLGLPD